ncbi:uncharacterized protein BYT42DRAFT_507127 [Radiomyces spectabilis]|uniref:uncharacterized protein n=1 Tax=Radiomyces spectabilis TaxID=64574 RepID=UPI00221FF464|nr:uncharacterized protein BYT42DRAFT_507127 [Radiomyces spectabilis]KAI8393535.1 hypothetical protein BYT42DRAFT_507127 [Radiomyces spectabilis]
MDIRHLLCEPCNDVKAWYPMLPKSAFQPVDYSDNVIHHHCINTPSRSVSSSSISSGGSTSSNTSQTNFSPRDSWSPPTHYSRRRTNSAGSSVSVTPKTNYSATNRRRCTSASGAPNAVTQRTPWTPMEDHLLRLGYEQGLSWAMVSSTYLPHRSRGCCWGRFKTLQNKDAMTTARESNRFGKFA